MREVWLIIAAFPREPDLDRKGTRAKWPSGSLPGARFQSHPIDLLEAPHPWADSNDSGPAISICHESLTIAASGTVVSNSALISATSITAVIRIRDLPASHGRGGVRWVPRWVGEEGDRPAC